MPRALIPVRPPIARQIAASSATFETAAKVANGPVLTMTMTMNDGDAYGRLWQHDGWERGYSGLLKSYSALYDLDTQLCWSLICRRYGLSSKGPGNTRGLGTSGIPLHLNEYVYIPYH